MWKTLLRSVWVWFLIRDFVLSKFVYRLRKCLDLFWNCRRDGKLLGNSHIFLLSLRFKQMCPFDLSLFPYDVYQRVMFYSSEIYDFTFELEMKHKQSSGVTACSHPLEFQSFLVGRPHLQWKQAFAVWPQGLHLGSEDIWKQQHVAGRLTVPCFDPKWSSTWQGRDCLQDVLTMTPGQTFWILKNENLLLYINIFFSM